MYDDHAEDFPLEKFESVSQRVERLSLEIETERYFIYSFQDDWVLLDTENFRRRKRYSSLDKLERDLEKKTDIDEILLEINPPERENLDDERYSRLHIGGEDIVLYDEEYGEGKAWIQIENPEDNLVNLEKTR